MTNERDHVGRIRAPMFPVWVDRHGWWSLHGGRAFPLREVQPQDHPGERCRGKPDDQRQGDPRRPRDWRVNVCIRGHRNPSASTEEHAMTRSVTIVNTSNWDGMRTVEVTTAHANRPNNPDARAGRSPSRIRPYGEGELVAMALQASLPIEGHHVSGGGRRQTGLSARSIPHGRRRRSDHMSPGRTSG